MSFVNKNPGNNQIIVAHPLPRALAFLMDFAVIFLLGILLVGKYILPNYYAEESLRFQQYLAENLASFSPEALKKVLNGVPKLPGVSAMLMQVDRVFFLLTWLYFSFSEVVFAGSSLCKKIFGLQIVRADGLRLSIVEIFFRESLKAVVMFSLWPILFIVNFLPIFWSSMRRSLYDHFCNTYVVYADTLPHEEPIEPFDNEEI